MANDLSDVGMSDDHYRLFGIFHPNALSKTVAAVQSKQRFVYYTTAETAVSILRGGEVWMRKSHLMNDYREIEHGVACLSAAYSKNVETMRALFEQPFPGFCAQLENLFNGLLPAIRTDTYITCLSEHDSSEDRYGRLSMWRAYGGAAPARVALVVSGGPLFRPTDALKAYTSPVAYYADDQVEKDFSQVLANVADNLELVKSLGQDQVRNYMFAVLRSAVVCTKHPGFFEEREWRVIYSPSFLKSDRITSQIATIDGTPQSICKLPLSDVPEEGLTGLKVQNFLDRVIIGPSKYPSGIYDALMRVLTDAGVSNPASKIVVSDVPLRS
jgi:hypothetical protein